MTFLRLLGIGAIYGLAFALVKSLFPEPFILLVLQGNQGSEGNLTVIALVYIGVGLVAGLIAAPVFGGILLARRASRDRDGVPATLSARLILSLLLSLFMGLISGTLILLIYATGLLPGGNTLDPLKLVNSSVFPTGGPMVIAWSIARDLLPAGLTGLFLSPLSGSMLLRLYTSGRGAQQKVYDEDF